MSPDCVHGFDRLQVKIQILISEFLSHSCARIDSRPEAAGGAKAISRSRLGAPGHIIYRPHFDCAVRLETWLQRWLVQNGPAHDRLTLLHSKPWGERDQGQVAHVHGPGHMRSDWSWHSQGNLATQNLTESIRPFC